MLTKIVMSSLRNAMFRRPVSSNWGSQIRSNSSGTANDQQLKSVLEKSFPGAKEIVVNDISGGCGAMFEVCVVSSEFNGLSKVKQHLAVSAALKKEIKDMHGIRIYTEASK